MVYGIGTRSYNRSTEHRDNKKAQAETTSKYLAGELKIDGTLPLVCTCRSFHYPHDPKAHRQLRSDFDWRTPEERKGTRYSLGDVK